MPLAGAILSLPRPSWEEPEAPAADLQAQGPAGCCCLLYSVEGPGSWAEWPRGTHSVEEVSELVLLKASSQKVTWGLQDTLFEPEGQ